MTGGIDEVFARTDSSQTLALLRDGGGSTLGLADVNGAVQTSYTYDPFGQTSVTGAANSNASQYTARENDGTGLYYYRARYYSPSLGRFISEDAIDLAGGINLYAYVDNDPINYRDPFGLEKDQTARDIRVRDFLAERLGGSVVEFGKVHNTSGVSFGEAVKRLTSMGFERYWDPHWDHWGGDDYEGKICDRWYHVTLGRPEKKYAGFYFETDPWTFMQIHSHYGARHDHWKECWSKSL